MNKLFRNNNGATELKFVSLDGEDGGEYNDLVGIPKIFGMHAGAFEGAASYDKV